MIDDVTLAKAAALSSATLHEAGDGIGALPSSLKPLCAKLQVCGRALPVVSPAGDNLWIHQAIYDAAAGDVIVVDVGQGLEFGYWGEVMTVAAQARGIAGLVINGGVRDSSRIVELGFPVFAANVCIRGTGKARRSKGSIGEPIRMGGVQIHHGDLVLGDADGVVVLPAERADDVIDAAFRRDQVEQLILDQLRAGRSTLEIYRLPTPRNSG